MPKRVPPSTVKHLHGPACRPSVCDAYAQRLARALRRRQDVIGQIEHPEHRITYVKSSLTWGSSPAFDRFGNWVGW